MSSETRAVATRLKTRRAEPEAILRAVLEVLEIIESVGIVHCPKGRRAVDPLNFLGRLDQLEPIVSKVARATILSVASRESDVHHLSGGNEMHGVLPALSGLD